MEETIKEILYDHKDGYADSAKSISSLFKAFIEWKDFSIGEPNGNGKYLYWEASFTLDELFQYWLDNIYNK